MDLIPLADTDLRVHPLNLGGNPFGWGADREQSFAVLDAYAAAGGNFIDTADMYSCWVEGNSGGESESIIGAWMAERGNRDDMVIATKVGMLEGRATLDPANIRACVEDSLRRLRTDRIDLYYAHQDDPDADQTAVAETFDALVREGKVRHLGASNFSLDRLRSAQEIARANGLAEYRVIQNRFNLVSRDDYRREYEEHLRADRMALLPFASLAGGFLTGKHIPGAKVDSVRGGAVAKYVDDQQAVDALGVLQSVACDHVTKTTAVALAWLLAHDTIPSVIASARVPEQLGDLLAGADLTLSPEEIARLDAAWPDAGRAAAPREQKDGAR